MHDLDLRSLSERPASPYGGAQPEAQAVPQLHMCCRAPVHRHDAPNAVNSTGKSLPIPLPIGLVLPVTGNRLPRRLAPGDWRFVLGGSHLAPGAPCLVTSAWLLAHAAWCLVIGVWRYGVGGVRHILVHAYGMSPLSVEGVASETMMSMKN